MKKLMLVLVLITQGVSACSQDKNANNFFAQSISTFESDYSVYKKETIEKAHFKDNAWLRNFENTGLNHVEVLVFKSKKEVDKNTHLWFKIIAYHYSSNQNALMKYSQLVSKRQTEGEVILGKDWDYVLCLGKYIVRLDGACLYSKQSWRKLKERFLSVVNKSFEIKTDSFMECECGGRCF
jgi:hypothetical protein